MVQTIFDEGSVLICRQTFDQDGETIPAGTEYLVTKSETVSADRDEPLYLTANKGTKNEKQLKAEADQIVHPKLTLELIEDNLSEQICQQLTIEGEEITNKFRLKS